MNEQEVLAAINPSKDVHHPDWQLLYTITDDALEYINKYVVPETKEDMKRCHSPNFPIHEVRGQNILVQAFSWYETREWPNENRFTFHMYFPTPDRTYEYKGTLTLGLLDAIMRDNKFPSSAMHVSLGGNIVRADRDEYGNYEVRIWNP